jgi:hypothetical protein
MVATDEVLRYLEDADFPATRDELVQVAASHGAGADVLKALRAMPPVEYTSRAEVARSAATDVAPGLSEAARAARLRDHKHQRVATHLRDAPRE